jgi:hypothetical protein
MSSRTFHVRGRVVTPTGAPATDVIVSVVDVDDILDDVLGVGRPRSDGRFELAFRTEAIRQDAFEREQIPSEMVVDVYRAREEGTPPLLHHTSRFDGLTFADGTEDLGDIVVPDDPGTGTGTTPIDLGDVKRLSLDEGVLAAALAEVAPLVERLTGWSNLRDAVEVRITDSPSEVQRELETSLGIACETGPSSWLFPLVERVLTVFTGEFGGLYDPVRRILWVHRRPMERLGLDALKVTLGHELVHAGQFRAHPEILESYVKTVVAFRKMGTQEPTLEDRRAVVAAFAFMANIEGHAQHLEDDELRRVFPLTAVIPHVPVLVAVVGLVLSAWERSFGGFPPPENLALRRARDAGEALFATAWDLKGAQYTWGLEFYRSRRAGDRPAPFSPSHTDEIARWVDETLLSRMQSRLPPKP